MAFLDQLAFELFKLTGRRQLMQCLWLYERDVNLDRLDQTCRHLYSLPINRLIEPSPLPFGRPRWVRAVGPTGQIHHGPDVRPRAQLIPWANEHARTPLDPVAGPVWHVSMQRFDDGSSAVSIVGSHLLIDGMGALRAIEQASVGAGLQSDYLPRGARHPLSARISDLCQALADIPRTVSALGGLLAMSLRQRRSGQRVTAPVAPGHPAADPDRTIDLPAVATMVDAQLWDQRARSLGGHPYALVPAFAARFAANMGRCRPSDGAVSLVVPINRRGGLNDDRAIAIAFSKLTIDPSRVTADLKPIDRTLKTTLRTAKHAPDVLEPLLPVITWVPRTATAALLNLLFTYGDDPPVSCSNLGELPAGLARIDGAPCDRLLMRAVDVDVTLRDLIRSCGHLVVVASRFNNTVCICIEAYQLDAGTTTEHVRDVAHRTLAEFGLSGSVEC